VIPNDSEPVDEPQVWTCRWTRIAGPVVNGHARSTLVWLCEYPYRTMMIEPPEPGACAGCPVFEDSLRRGMPSARDLPPAVSF